VGRPTKSLSYLLAEVLVRPVMAAVTHGDWRGGENLPVGAGFVVAVNHISHADPFTVAHYLVNQGVVPRFLGKAGVFEIPVLGSLLRRAGQIPVYRESSHASRAYAAAVDAVRSGEAVVIYPEGTLTSDPDLWPMRGKSGAARIAHETGCLVVPVAQWGSQDLLSPYRKVPRLLPRAWVTVAAGPPVRLTWPSEAAPAAAQAAAVDAATEDIMAAMTMLLQEIRGGTPPARRWDPAEHGDPVTGNPAGRWRR